MSGIAHQQAPPPSSHMTHHFQSEVSHTLVVWSSEQVANLSLPGLQHTLHTSALKQKSTLYHKTLIKIKRHLDISPIAL